MERAISDLSLSSPPQSSSPLPSPRLPADAVVIEGLCKTYKGNDRRPGKRALEGVDLRVPRGSVFGLLGPNGAGKSTLINIMAGLTVKTAGTVSIWGSDIDHAPRQARAAIGVVPQELNIDPFFTPATLLDLQAGLYGVPRRERRTTEILEAVGLAPQAHSYARTLSGGMRRRLMVAKALVHRPPVLVLDEPTAGVDVELRQQLWDYVRALNRAGTTILLTTHYLEEAEQLCDRIAIINQGRVVANEATTTLVQRVDAKELIVTLTQPVAAIPEALVPFTPTLLDERRLLFGFRRSENQIAKLLLALQTANLGIADLTTHEADLEDIFLQLTRAPLNK